MDATPIGARAILDVAGLDGLLRALVERGYRVVGPVVRDGAITYADVTGVGDLPSGWGDAQEAGTYRLTERGDGALFGYAVGPDSARRFLDPPERTLWLARRDGGGFHVDDPPPEPRPLALIGLRPCDLAAVAVQDRVLLHTAFPDTAYRAARERAFVVAVACGAPAPTCFCASMGTGPAVQSGFDLALTELITADAHHFVVEVGSDRGAALLAEVHAEPAEPAAVAAAAAVVEESVARMARHVDPEAARDLLATNLEHAQWDDVAERCLSCASCTLVCPTCFCTSVTDVTDLSGQRAERVQRWDSCFTLDHSYLHGGSVRADLRSRYRQWLTHKLSTWWDQFDVSGCVGCGRCITWCPAAIDLTAEVAAIAGAPVEAVAG